MAMQGISAHVKAAGYQGLHESITSDHIMLWEDVDLQTFFGSDNPSIVLPWYRDSMQTIH